MLLISYTLSLILGLFQLQLLASIGVLDTWRPLATSAQPLREVAMVLGEDRTQLTRYKNIGMTEKGIY